MSAKQVNLWEFQDDITKSLHVEQHIQTEFDELNPRNINTNKGSATIKDVSIKLNKENTIHQLLITIVHKGKTYVSKNPLIKENIEYLCGIANVKSFKIDEIIGAKIKFSKINKNKLIIRQNYYNFIPDGFKPISVYWIFLILYFYILFGTINIPMHIIIITLSIIFGHFNIENKNDKSVKIFEFNPIT